MSRYTLATLYGVGLVPKAPGTMGSLVAALLAFALLHMPFGFWAVSYGIVALGIVGVRSTDRYMAAHATAHDPKEVVVDELVGQWLTYMLPAIGMWIYDASSIEVMMANLVSPLYCLLGFVWFRFFDILKPWPISLADRKVGGGFGVMLDDLLAGIAASAALLLSVMFLASNGA